MNGDLSAFLLNFFEKVLDMTFTAVHKAGFSVMKVIL
jgi:hypothetical protein